MTTTLEPTTPTAESPQTMTVVTPAHIAVRVDDGNGGPRTRRNLYIAIPAWLLAVVVGLVLVAYGFGPLFHQRDQRIVQRQAREAVRVAANEATGLAGVTVSKHAPDIGSAVGIIEIGDLKLQQGVVEGVGSSQTRRAPGHVPGSAGLGQKGNAVIVARNRSFGATFHKINTLKRGAKIVVATLQGPSVYTVSSVRRSPVTESIFADSTDDRLTLVTSGSLNPFNRSKAVVVVAKMDGTPFVDTPQATLSAHTRGTSGDSGAVATIVLAILAYALVMAGGVLLYRRLRSRTAYLLTIAPVVALTVVTAEALSRAFPAWM